MERTNGAPSLGSTGPAADRGDLPAGGAAAIRSVLLLGPALMPQVLEWRRALASVAGECRLASLHPGEPADEDRPQVVMLDGWSRGPVLGALRSARALRRLLARWPADLVVAYYLTSYGLLASRVVPGRYVVVAAGSDIFPQSLVRPRLWAAARAARRALGAAAWTPLMAERLKALGAPPERILVGPRGLDLDLFRPGDPRPAGAGPLRVVSTRRLRPIFRHDRLIAAVAAVRGSGLGVRLELIGEGTERPRLERLAREAGLAGDALFPGSLKRDALASRLRDADVFVSLSTTDGLSTALLEAMASGLVPVVSDIPANREVVRHGSNGLLVAGDDVGGIAEALRRLARDAGFRDAARRHNLALARERFDVRANTRRFLEAARRWLGEAAR